MESHTENTRSHSSVTCYRILREDYSYIHLDSWDPTHTFINTDQSEVREKVRDEPITETEQGWLPPGISSTSTAASSEPMKIWLLNQMLPSNFQWQLYSNLWWLRATQQSSFYACGDHEDGGHVTCLGQSEVSAQANQRPQPLSSARSEKSSKANRAISIKWTKRHFGMTWKGKPSKQICKPKCKIQIKSNPMSSAQNCNINH